MSRARCVRELSTLLAAASIAAFAALSSSAWAQRGAPGPSAANTVTVQTPEVQQADAPAQRPSQADLTGGVAALVNDDVISTYDLRQRALLFIVTAGVQPTQDSLPQIQEQALRSLIDEHLEMQELHKMEKQQKFPIVADDDEVAQALRQLASENNSSLDQLSGQFAQVGLDVSTLREQIRTQISWNRMIQGRYGTRVRIGNNQIAMQLQRLKASAGAPKYLVSEIFIDSSSVGGPSEALSGAQQLITQIQQGAPFAPVARQFSKAPSAANGGDMGWVSAAELQGELAAALAQMRPGQLSEPIPVNDGVYVLQLRDKKAGGGSQMVSLKQAAVRLTADASSDQVAAATKTLQDFKASSGATCTDLEAKAGGVSGLVTSDLGESDVADLSGDFRNAAANLSPNQFSDPIRTSVGLHLIMVCKRRSADAKAPSRDDVENRLYADQLSMLSRRYLRDLRNSATIETP